jgi:formylglycine-generating enzyme required for sulfatase activity
MKSIWFTICVVAFVVLCVHEAQSDEPGKTQAPAADSIRARKPGAIRDDNGLKMTLVWCPPGDFKMEPEQVRGQDNDDDPVSVTLTHGYWLGKYEVTQSEWKRVMATEPWKDQKFTKAGNDFPATCMSWNDSIDFCGKLTEQERMAGRLPEGWEYTLPTEAQWDRACRAGTETKFSFGDDASELGESAWYANNALQADEGSARQVGRKKPNPWGLSDMHGNVGEWCRDWYSEKLPGGRDPEVSEKVSVPVRVLRATRTNQGRIYELVDTKQGSFRVIRGGTWQESAETCQSASRSRFDPSMRNNYLVGFRVALSLSGSK